LVRNGISLIDCLKTMAFGTYIGRRRKEVRNKDRMYVLIPNSFQGAKLVRS
jgi:hypothetical protein